MSVKKATKAIGLISVITAILLTTVSFGSVMWSYIVSCSNSFYETEVGILNKQGLHCYGTTHVEPTEDAGVTVYLQTLDSDGDWVTYTAWEDVDSEVAVVEENYAVPDGTYRLWLVHKAYDPDDHSTPLEIFNDYTEEIVLP